MNKQEAAVLVGPASFAVAAVVLVVVAAAAQHSKASHCLASAWEDSQNADAVVDVDAEKNSLEREREINTI